MKKVAALSSMVLSLMAVDATAGYQLVEQGEVESYYVDPDMIRRLGAIAELRYVREFHEATTDSVTHKPVKSRVVTMLLDCQQRRGRLVSYDLHSEARGLGDPIRSELIAPDHPSTQWVIIDSRVGAAMMAIACAPQPAKAEVPRRRRSHEQGGALP